MVPPLHKDLMLLTLFRGRTARVRKDPLHTVKARQQC
jgi:hypothetical protein